MPPSNIATAADYADAMMIARRAKNVLFFLLLLMLLLQLGTFFVAHSTNWILPDATPSLADTVGPATLPATLPTTQPAVVSDARRMLPAVLRYLTALIDFLGIVLILVLAVVLLLIIKIMLVGRLIGVARVTSAFVWCVFLALLLFPWQAFLQNTDFNGDFKLPGVLFTWSELVHPTAGAKFSSSDFNQSILRWARFVGWPVIALILLLVVQAKSSRGLRAALGESELESPDDMALN
ncbi:MAG: hypothetical protein JWN40_739 [Phycisphaerales bacterium]|nr:hypothetical protein [Phycisphaerales bacterium]